jgi:prepilin-type N-terminal cleavage/methylation domain-containing protein
MKFHPQKFGFTLVELLVVLGIMAVLAGVAYTGAQEIREIIRDNKRRADLHKLARAIELFKSDYGQYPANTFYSDQDVSELGWTANETMMPFLHDGGNMPFPYLNSGVVDIRFVNIQGDYLDEYIADPINNNNSWLADNDTEPINHHHVYVYWGSAYANESVMDTTAWPEPSWPIDCPVSGSCNSWAGCCNGGCYDDFCDYVDPEVTWTWYSPINGVSQWCYGDGSKRSMALLAADLENESKPEERIDEVFSFCPTKENDPDTFNNIKRYFFRGKTCYEKVGDADCSDNGFTGWSPWGLNRHNYFVPLVGEYNLN